MAFNYTAARRHFRDNALEMPDFKPVYKHVFDAVLEDLEFSNEGQKDDQHTRTIAPNFDRHQQFLKIGPASYYSALNWLNEHGFVQFVKGAGAIKGFVKPLNLPDCTTSEEKLSGSNAEVMQKQYTDLVTSVQKLIRSNAEVIQKLSGSNAEVIANFPPPHTPPLEDKIFSITPITDDSEGGKEGMISSFEKNEKGYHKPLNVELTADEEADLLAACGPGKLQSVLLRVSAFKRRNGGELKTSDYQNAISWAIREVEDEDKRRLRAAEEDNRIREHPATSESKHTKTPKAILAMMQQ